MKKRKTASRLARAIDRFLTHKRTLGHHYRQEGWLLQRLEYFVTESGRRDLDEKCFTRWLMSLQDRHPNTRRKWYQIVRNFCCYRRKNEPGCFLPSTDGVPRPRPYVMPVIVEPWQIAHMIGIASKLPNTNASPLREPALRLTIVLLYTCGLRLGELLRLSMGDIEEKGTVLRIRKSKFHKTRLVAMSQSTTRELQTYLRKRRKAFAVDPDMPLLCNRHGGRCHQYSHPGLQHAINQLFDSAGVRGEQGKRPRVHDLRHSFAVQALISWYQDGADVQSLLPKLALYMGHVSIESTAYYLHWVPTLQSLASDRFEQQFGKLVRGGAR
jgi:integrase/recombinase XerD